MKTKWVEVTFFFTGARAGQGSSRLRQTGDELQSDPKRPGTGATLRSIQRLGKVSQYLPDFFYFATSPPSGRIAGLASVRPARLTTIIPPPPPPKNGFFFIPLPPPHPVDLLDWRLSAQPD